MPVYEYHADMLIAETPYWLPDNEALHGLPVLMGIALAVFALLLCAAFVTRIVGLVIIEPNDARGKPGNRLSKLFIAFALAAIVSMFAVFGIGTVTKMNAGAETTESLRLWASDVYDIELSSRAVGDLKPGGYWNGDGTVAVQYEGETVVVKLVPYNEVDGAYILVRNNSLEPLKASR